MQEGIHQRNDGHYEMPLPLKNDNVELPNNKELALSRLMKLKQRLKSDTQYRKDYVNFMQENIKNGFAEKVPKEEVSDKNKHVWYIPHHGVYHNKKPGKMRVVFDCSALYQGVSLNQQLLQGPVPRQRILESLEEGILAVAAAKAKMDSSAKKLTSG